MRHQMHATSETDKYWC